jgi:2-keto-4-pentenoate hydratase/2-oxohepta-3-ene-1,7-dioic acid hydratase in catechol pathway
MRLASWVADSHPTWGASCGEHLVDLGPSGANLAASLREALIADMLPSLTSSVLEAAPRVGLGDVTWLPVIPEPRKIICVGVNYRAHREETKHADFSAPTLFVRFADSQAGHGASIRIPPVCEKFDYEGELAVVIGREVWQVSPEDAMSIIAGYAVFNDFTARDWQKATSQWTPGKNFPGTGAIGPYLVTADEIADVTSLKLETRVNGAVRQAAGVSDLIFDIPSLLTHISTFTRLNPGDLVVTGTPGGVGIAMTPPALLADGDVVEVTISQIGTLRNVVRTSAESSDDTDAATPNRAHA